MNILVTSAGRRVELVQAFQETLHHFDADAKVLVTDMAPDIAPAAYIADGAYKVVAATDDSYPDQLLQICRDNGVGLVIPTIDYELQVLSDNKERFSNEGVAIAISEPEFIRMARNKLLTHRFFVEHHIDIPEIYPAEALHYPLIAKPIDGSGSRNVHLCKTEADISESLHSNTGMIFMQAIDTTRYQEYSVDMYYGRDNKLKCLVPRHRIEVRNGEISKGRTVRNEIIPYLQERLSTLDGCTGCICLQLFYNLDNHDIKAIELNPRFGGGYPLSYRAGANYPEMLIREYLLDEALDSFDQWQDKLLMLRYDNAVYRIKGE